MNYAQINKFDIANGSGVRVSLFVQGCPIHCPGCFNQETWDFNGGKPFTEDTINEILLFMNDNIAGLSILGGEPLADQNVIDVAWLTTAFKQRFPDKTVWLWTGYAWDKVKSYPVMLNIDVCVAGPFDISKRDLSLKWCGSSNQQVIDVHASLICNKPILYTGVVI